jgi:hypothetical protein
MNKLYSESKELLTILIALSALTAGSFILLVVLLLAMPLALIAELLQRFMRLSLWQRATTRLQRRLTK